METNYGTLGGDRPVLRSTATLACIGRRQNYFRDEFLATLEILQRGDVRPDRLIGSWAGAFGPTQFMPTAFKRYAVDFDRDGRRDVVDSVPDIIASTANNLKTRRLGARPDLGLRSGGAGEFQFPARRPAPLMTIREWQRLGITRPAASRSRGRTTAPSCWCRPASQGPGFLMLHNFRVIMRYNPAEAYALAIGHLADRLRGGGPFVQAWPRYERVLSRAERLELQQLLAQRGYDVGEPDGRSAPARARRSASSRPRIGQVPDGFASAGAARPAARAEGNQPATFELTFFARY